MLRQSAKERRVPDVWVFHISLLFLQFLARELKTKTPSGFGARRRGKVLANRRSCEAPLLLSLCVHKSCETENLVFL
jgi:hypothetical protein